MHAAVSAGMPTSIVTLEAKLKRANEALALSSDRNVTVAHAAAGLRRTNTEWYRYSVVGAGAGAEGRTSSDGRREIGSTNSEESWMSAALRVTVSELYCRTEGCRTQRLKVRASTGLCLNCSNKIAREQNAAAFRISGGDRRAAWRIVVDDSGQPMESLESAADVQLRNALAAAVLGKPESGAASSTLNGAIALIEGADNLGERCTPGHDSRVKKKGGSGDADDDHKHRWPYVGYENHSAAVNIADRLEREHQAEQARRKEEDELWLNFKPGHLEDHYKFCIPKPPTSAATTTDWDQEGVVEKHHSSRGVPRRADFHIQKPSAMAKAPLPSGGQHSFQRPNNIRPQGAAKPVVPSRDGIPGHNCKAKTHVPSVHGLLSGRKVASKTYVPSRDGPVRIASEPTSRLRRNFTSLPMLFMCCRRFLQRSRKCVQRRQLA